MAPFLRHSSEDWNLFFWGARLSACMLSGFSVPRVRAIANLATPKYACAAGKGGMVQ